LVQLAINALHQPFFGDGVAVAGVVQKLSDVAHVLTYHAAGMGKGGHQNRCFRGFSHANLPPGDYEVQAMIPKAWGQKNNAGSITRKTTFIPGRV
jgi:hypothetical protein